jgi:hypothetical protein
VHRLLAFGLEAACHHTALLDVGSSYPAESEMPSFGREMRLGLVTLGGSTICS